MTTLFGQGIKIPKRNDKRIILHFVSSKTLAARKLWLNDNLKDYDCFYASVFENENPALKSVPLVGLDKNKLHLTNVDLLKGRKADDITLSRTETNYRYLRLGLRKLQLVTEAKKQVPDLVIVLGEKLDRFREASKNLYRFLRSYSWNGKAERLGFDEVFLDVTDIVDYNQTLLNPNNLENSFFFLDLLDPTRGFEFDATTFPDNVYPNLKGSSPINLKRNDEEFLTTRLTLGSYLAQYLRLQLENETGFTSSVGISTSKFLSKLVGNLNKPNGQTTLIPPYNAISRDESSYHANVIKFIDDFEIGKIPGIGFKSSQCIRNHILSRPAAFENGLIYGKTRETVSVHDVRTYPGMGPSLLENILGGSGAKRGIGGKTWSLINGIDDDEIKQARNIPTQISIENSYLCLDTTPKLLQELHTLTMRLLRQMHIDLLEDHEDSDDRESKRWIAWPRTIRISTRLRSTHLTEIYAKNFSRFSKSSPLPNFVFNLRESLESIVEKLVQENIIPLIYQLHSQSSSANISLINICVANMKEAIYKESTSKARSISQMFQAQKSSSNLPEDGNQDKANITSQNEYSNDFAGDNSVEDESDSKQEIISMYYQGFMDESESDAEYQETCGECGTVLPGFALVAHKRFHREDC